MVGRRFGLSPGSSAPEIMEADLVNKLRELREQTLDEIYGESIPELAQELWDICTNILNQSKKEPGLISTGTSQKATFYIPPKDGEDHFLSVVINRTISPSAYKGLQKVRSSVILGFHHPMRHHAVFDQGGNQVGFDDRVTGVSFLNVASIWLEDGDPDLGTEETAPRTNIGDEGLQGSITHEGKSTITVNQLNPQAVFLERVKKEIGSEKNNVVKDMDADEVSQNMRQFMFATADTAVALFPSLDEEEDKVPFIGYSRTLRTCDAENVQKILDVIKNGKRDDSRKTIWKLEKDIEKRLKKKDKISKKK